MLSNECSQKSDIARLMVIGILKTYNYGLKCSLTFYMCIFAFYSSDQLFPAIGDPIDFSSFTYLCTVAIYNSFRCVL